MRVFGQRAPWVEVELGLAILRPGHCQLSDLVAANVVERLELDGPRQRLISLFQLVVEVRDSRLHLMRTRGRATDQLHLAQLDEQATQIRPEGLFYQAITLLKFRVVELHQVADDKLVKINNFLPEFRKWKGLLVPAGPASPQVIVGADVKDAELLLATLRTSRERRGDHIAWAEGLGHYRILSGSSAKFGRRIYSKQVMASHAKGNFLHQCGGKVRILRHDTTMLARSKAKGGHPPTPAAASIAYTQTTCSTGDMPLPQPSAANIMGEPCSPT